MKGMDEMIVDKYNRRIVINGNTQITFKEIIDEIKPYSDDIMYLGGSLIEGAVDKYSEGMGNRFSDLDVFIIREHTKFDDTNAEYIEHVRKIYFSDNLLIGLDIEVYDAQFVESLVTVLNTLEITANIRSENTFVGKLPIGSDFLLVNTFLDRLLYSVCIWNNSAFDKLISDIRFTHFLSLKVHNLVTKMDGVFPDVLGNAEIGQLDVALFCMRELYISLMETILADENIFVDRAKWVPLKFRNFVRVTKKYKNIYDHYLLLFFSELRDKAECQKVIQTTVVVSKQVIEEILLGGVTL
jgi:hypothetical protein